MGLFNFFFKKDKKEETQQEQTQATTVAEPVQTTQQPIVSPQQMQPIIPQATNEPIYAPKTFEEVQSLIYLMRDRNTKIIVNIAGLDTITAQRFIDTLSGATAALRGTTQQMQPTIFYFCPNANKPF